MYLLGNLEGLNDLLFLALIVIVGGLALLIIVLYQVFNRRKSRHTMRSDDESLRRKVLSKADVREIVTAVVIILALLIIGIKWNCS